MGRQYIVNYIGGYNYKDIYMFIQVGGECYMCGRAVYS